MMEVCTNGEEKTADNGEDSANGMGDGVEDLDSVKVACENEGDFWEMGGSREESRLEG